MAQWLRTRLSVQETWVQSCVRKMPWRRAWQPTPVFLPGESHGQRSLVGSSPQGRRESGMTCQLKGSGEIRNEVATTGDVHVRMNVSRGLNQRRWVLRELGRITTDSLRIPIWPQSKKKKKKKRLLTHL